VSIKCKNIFTFVGSLQDYGLFGEFVKLGVNFSSYRHLIKKGENFPECLSDKQCEDLLRKDLGTFEKCISNYVSRKINDNQFSALVSFSFNVGCGAFQGVNLVPSCEILTFSSLPLEAM